MRRALIAASATTIALVALVAIPASAAPPKWTLGPLARGEVLFSVRGSYVSGQTDVRLLGVKLPPFSKDKRADFQAGGRFWVLGRHDPRNISLLYGGQTVRAVQSLQNDEALPAIEYHVWFTPKGAAKPVFSKLGRGTGTMTFTTAAGPVRLRVPVRIKPYGGG
jgi:hypothetical protein